MFAESDDPERLVPVVEKAEDIMIAVSGDPLRTNAYVFVAQRDPRLHDDEAREAAGGVAPCRAQAWRRTPLGRPADGPARLR